MNTIKINQNGGLLSVKILFESQHVVSYAYRIFDESQLEVFQKESGDSNEDEDLNTRALNESPKFYINKEIRISLDLADTEGSGNTYRITVYINQDGDTCGDPIVITGTSTNNDLYLVRWRQFIS